MPSIIRGGPSELFRGILASSLRDAPYAGLFLVSYEVIKHDAASILPPSSPLVCAALNSSSAATLATHPFDVIKVHPPLQVSFVERTTLSYPFSIQGCKFAMKTNTVAWSRHSWSCGIQNTRLLHRRHKWTSDCHASTTSLCQLVYDGCMIMYKSNISIRMSSVSTSICFTWSITSRHVSQ